MSRKALLIFGPFLALLISTVLPVRAMQPAAVKQIIAQADRARGNIDGIVWTADITSVEDNTSRHRTLTIKNRGMNTVAEFTRPAKVRGNKLVMLDRNMWFVKPGLHKPVPISPRQKLLGGAANGDIASTNYAGDYHAVLIGEELVDGETCYLFELTASSKKTTYDRIRYWISTTRKLGLKAQFFSVTGKLIKTALFRYQNRIVTAEGPQPFVSKMTILDQLIRGNVTTMVYRDVHPQHLAAAVFNLNLMLR